MAPSARHRFQQQRHSTGAAARPSVGTEPRSDARTSTRAGSLRPESSVWSILESLESEPLSETPKSSRSDGGPACTFEVEGKSTESAQVLKHLESSCGVSSETEWTAVVGKSFKRDYARALRELEDAVGRLVEELAPARAKRRSVGDTSPGKLTEAKPEIVDKVSMIDNLRKLLVEVCREYAEEKRDAEENALRIAELERKLTQAREAGARRADSGDRFEYVLAFNGQAGSVPRSVLASAPESILYKPFCGEWDYARDKDGRAVITCHPERWAAVLEHLATGAVPAERDPLLLEQARYWNLSRLVGGLEALTPGVIVLESDESHLEVRCTFVNVTEQLHTRDGCIGPTFIAVGGRWWAVNLFRSGFGLTAEQSPGGTDFKPSGAVALLWRILLRSEELTVLMNKGPYSFEKPGFAGETWETLGYSIHQLISEPLARAHDSLVVELNVCFANPVVESVDC